jgi:hypothetical protein
MRRFAGAPNLESDRVTNATAKQARSQTICDAEIEYTFKDRSR